MSKVEVVDKRKGDFEVLIHFSYGECDRLPFNALRKIHATLDEVENGGVIATSRFNLRNAREAVKFVEVLRLFGEEGAFSHGSGADPAELHRAKPPEEEEESLLPAFNAARAANAGGSATAPPAAAPPPASATASPSTATVPAAEETDDDLVLEEEVAGESAEPAREAEPWEIEGDKAVEASIGANEDRHQTLARVGKAAGPRYTAEMIRNRLIRLLHEKYQDTDFVAAFLKRRGWKDIDAAAVNALLAGS
jgi:hypothetical protein